jgi:hypothetical protein
MRAKRKRAARPPRKQGKNSKPPTKTTPSKPPAKTKKSKPPQKNKKKGAPPVGLEPTLTRLKAVRSTN